MTDQLHTDIILRDTGLKDDFGQRIAFQIQLQQCPGGCYRVWGRQLRNDRPWGRGTAPLRVKDLEAAKALAVRLFNDHLRYVQRNTARRHLQALEAEEGPCEG